MTRLHFLTIIEKKLNCFKPPKNMTHATNHNETKNEYETKDDGRTSKRRKPQIRQTLLQGVL